MAAVPRFLCKVDCFSFFLDASGCTGDCSRLATEEGLDWTLDGTDNWMILVRALALMIIQLSDTSRFSSKNGRLSDHS